MPMKKKKGGKKKKSSSKSIADKEDPGEIDPGTLIAATNADGTINPMEKDGGKKKKKGKKRKKKVSLAEKKLERLEKATEKLMKEKSSFRLFVYEMDKWLTSNATRIQQLFKTYDYEGECILSYDEFKSGMFDLEIPCSEVQCHLLAKLLDPENSGEIDYTELHKGLQYTIEVEEQEMEEEHYAKILDVTKRDLDHCRTCKMAVTEPPKIEYARDIDIVLTCITFKQQPKHPTHIQVTGNAYTSIYSLIQMILKETGIASTKLSIFRDDRRVAESMIEEHTELRELWGESMDEPEEIELFYDYRVEFLECPILLCDYYFVDSN